MPCLPKMLITKKVIMVCVLLTVKCISAVFEDGTFKGIANALTSLY